jgi:hypothetical protein
VGIEEASLLCCKELKKLCSKLRGEACITATRGFQLNCLEKEVLAAVYYARVHYGQQASFRMR